MSEFPIPYRDYQFTLFEHLKVQESVGLDRDDIEAILEAMQSFCADFLAPLNRVMDRQGVKRHEDGSVTTPEGLKAAYQQFASDGWIGMAASEEVGGQALPQPVLAAIDEMIIGACCSFSNYFSLSRACANMLLKHASDDQISTWVPKLISGEWQGTMCLTEAGAGSDVGASLTKATPIEGARYNIEGSKVFITSGEHDLTNNFVHIVLARIEGDPDGVKGLSIFIVPKFRLTESGEPGEYNNVFCAGIEHKMGIHGSVTTTLEFGQSGPCEGYLIGSPRQGISIMFEIMNEERIAVGQQGQGLAAIATGHAMKYAQERIQGTNIRKGKSMVGSKVAIVQHPDVRRMLMTCKAQSEALRALMFWTSVLIHKEKQADLPEAERHEASVLAALLTPICKSHGSEVGFQVCSQAMQVYGGYGYTTDFPVEQFVRDSRIACVYEGTNGIQAIDLLFRKVMGDGAKALTLLGEKIKADLSAMSSPRLSGLTEPILASLGELDKVTRTLIASTKEDLGITALGATPYLTLVGNVVCAWLLAQQASISAARLEELGAPAELEGLEEIMSDQAEMVFYASKIETTRFYVEQVLSENRWRAAQILSGHGRILSPVALGGV